MPRSGSIDATVCIFHGRPFEGNLTTGCSQHRVQPAHVFALILSTFPIENGYKVVMIFPTPPNGSKIGLMTLTYSHHAQGTPCTTLQRGKLGLVQFGAARTGKIHLHTVYRTAIQTCSMCTPSLNFRVTCSCVIHVSSIHVIPCSFFWSHISSLTRVFHDTLKKHPQISSSVQLSGSVSDARIDEPVGLIHASMEFIFEPSGSSVKFLILVPASF